MKTSRFCLFYQFLMFMGLLLGFSQSAIAIAPVYSSQQNQTMAMRLWVSHVYLSLKDQNSQLDQQLSCLEKANQKTECQQINIDVQAWQFAYQQMRLLLAMSQAQSYHEPYRQKLIEESSGSKFWPYQFTLRLQHLFGQIVMPLSQQVDKPAALNYLSSFEIEQVLALRQMQTVEINKKWLESQPRLQDNKRGADPSQIYWDFVRSQRTSYYEQARKNYFNLLARYPFLVFVEKPSADQEPSIQQFYQAKRIQKKLLTQLQQTVWDLKVKNEFYRDEYLNLLGFSYLEDSFLQQFQNISSVQLGWTQLKKRFSRFELMQDLTYLGGLVALGITCVVGPGKFFKILSFSKTLSALGVGACSLGAGLGFNYLFYDQSLSRFESTYRRLLSHPEATQIVLELSELEDRDFALLLDTLFLGVGTGIGQMATKLGPQAKSLLNRIRLQQETL